jgi:putative nucleotidyltransferase with HDIG domain
MTLSRAKTQRGRLRRWGLSRDSSWVDRARAARALLPLGVALGFFAVASLIIIQGGAPFPYRLGQSISDRQIITRVMVPDSQKLRVLKETEAQNVPNYYILNEAIIKAMQASVTNLREKASGNETLAALKKELDKQDQKWQLDEQAFAALRELATEKGATQFNRHLKDMIEAAKAEPLVRSPTKEDRESPSAAQYSALIEAGKPRKVSIDDLKYVTNLSMVQQVALAVVQSFPSALQPALAAKWVDALRPDPGARIFAPIYEFDKKATDEAIQRAKDSVNPDQAAKPAGTPIFGPVLTRETGLNALKPGIIREEDLEALRIEHRAYLDELRRQQVFFSVPLKRVFGLATIVLFVTIGLALYVWGYGDAFVRNPRQLLSFTGVMLLMLLLARVMALAGWPRELAIVPVVMTGAILTIPFKQRFAFGATCGLAVLVTMAVGGNFHLFLVLMAAMGMSVFTLKEIRTRGKVLDVGGLTALATFVLTGCVNVLDGQTLRFSAQSALIAAASGLGAGFVIFGILPLIEQVFDVVTALTLLEWGSIHQPLLQKLREQAPGTYSHSQTLADIAMTAADAIGADGLLTRTGAYYHDIGKTLKPNYFVENYEMRVDQHKRLQPTMSMLIIAGHVRDGQELARQYGLPRELRAFIAEHHGTTLVEYFYHEASVRTAAEGKPQPSESEFRYPGPKPQSKETAILMLADAVEGAVRAMPEPNRGRIEQIVHQIAMKRLMDGQLDECNMTLKDLRRVEDSLTRTLISIYHSRIAYPKTKVANGDAFKPKEASSAG